MLNDLGFFHIADGSPGELPHVVFEWFAQYLCQHLVLFINDNVFTHEDINNEILTFQYSEMEKKNKQEKIKDKSLSEIINNEANSLRNVEPDKDFQCYL